MIPILFSPKAREYNNNGLGVLVDAGYCTVTEERNGEFELELQYPVNGSHYSDLSVDCQILAKPNETSKPQAFRIYNITKPMNGVVTVRAEHISYELSSIVVMPFSANSSVDAFDKIKFFSTSENPFEFLAGLDADGALSFTKPVSARAILGGIDGSILDVYGGEYEFDNYSVKLHNERGADNGVVIAYAKNLTGVKCEERIDGVVTGAIAYWSQETDGIVQAVYGDLQTTETKLSYSRNVIVDCSSEFDAPPSKISLNEYAQNYIKTHKNVPYFSVSVEFVNLGDTEEYKQYKGLYRVNLCDTVTIKHPLYGIGVKAKVVKTVFDSISEKYEKIEVGEISANISKTIAYQEKEISQKVGQSALDKAIENATSAITGYKGGYVVLDPPKQPQRLLIMDTPDKETAVNVWQFNMEGLGYSGTGINGDYDTAITADGQIVADFITAGTLDAASIKVKNLSANSITSGLLSSSNGFSYFNLETGVIHSGGNDYYTEINNGSIVQYMDAFGGNIGGLLPTAGAEKAAICLYYDKSNLEAEGVNISYQDSDGYFTNIAEFRESQISIYKDLYLNDNLALKLSDGKLAVGNDGVSIDLWGGNGARLTSYYETVVGAYSENGRVLLETTYGDVNVKSAGYFNVSAKTICLGAPNTVYEDYKVLISGKTYADGNILCTNTIKSKGLIVDENAVIYGQFGSAGKITCQSDIEASGKVYSGGVALTSTEKVKENIVEEQSVLDAIKSSKIYRYNYKTNKTKKQSVGFVIERETPVDVITDDGGHVDLYSMASINWKATQEIIERLEKLEQRGGKNNGKQN